MTVMTLTPRWQAVHQMVYSADVNVDFSDVPSLHWSYSYVASAFSKGIISGRGNGTFGLGDFVSRQDASVMIYNVLKQGGMISGEDKQSFADSSVIADYAKNAVSALHAIGLINGKGNNMFMPLDNLTRAEAAAMIWRMLQR